MLAVILTFRLGSRLKMKDKIPNYHHAKSFACRIIWTIRTFFWPRNTLAMSDWPFFIDELNAWNFCFTGESLDKGIVCFFVMPNTLQTFFYIVDDVWTNLLGHCNTGHKSIVQDTVFFIKYMLKWEKKRRPFWRRRLTTTFFVLIHLRSLIKTRAQSETKFCFFVNTNFVIRITLDRFGSGSDR